MASPDISLVIDAFLALFASAFAVFISYPAIKEAVGTANSDFFRVAVSAFAGSSSAGILYLYVRDKIRTMPLLFRRGHVIICGLNHHTSLMVKDMVKNGVYPVIIEADPKNPYLESCSVLGLITLVGPPSDPVMLKKAAVTRAGHILSLGDVDEDNAEVALTCLALVQKDRYPPLTCTIQMINPMLYGIIRRHAFAARTGAPVRVEFFNQYALGARVLLDTWPPFPPALPVPPEKEAPEHTGISPDSPPPAVIIVGAGMLGTSIATRLARTWYQAHKQDGRRFTLTLIDTEADRITSGLVHQYPQMEKTCEIISLPLDIRSAEFKTGTFLADARLVHGYTAYICLDDDSLGLYAALTLHHNTTAEGTRFIVRMDHNASVAKLISGEQAALDSIRTIFPVNLFELTAAGSLILAGEEEILARAIHENYCSRERAKGHTRETNRLLVSWDELGTLTHKKDGIEGKEYQDSNRRQATFIWTKLALAGCSVGPITDWDAPDTFRFTEGELSKLERLEHDRWMDEKIAGGWRYGPVRNDAKKLHPSIIPFDELSEPEKEKDRDTIRQIPELLSYIDFQVNRE
ncbi:MAG: hypothetical protein GYA23_12525 [Methanomicrobiales archaeon]|nr:hypothetical protein [Methanomicrobiales archaeon]